MDVVVGAGEAGTDVVCELAVVVEGFAIEHYVADELADRGAGLGGDGCLGVGAEGQEGGEEGNRFQAHGGTVTHGSIGSLLVGIPCGVYRISYLFSDR